MKKKILLSIALTSTLLLASCSDGDEAKKTTPKTNSGVVKTDSAKATVSTGITNSTKIEKKDACELGKCNFDKSVSRFLEKKGIKKVNVLTGGYLYTTGDQKLDGILSFENFKGREEGFVYDKEGNTLVFDKNFVVKRTISKDFIQNMQHYSFLMQLIEMVNPTFTKLDLFVKQRGLFIPKTPEFDKFIKDNKVEEICLKVKQNPALKLELIKKIQDLMKKNEDIMKKNEEVNKGKKVFDLL